MQASHVLPHATPPTGSLWTLLCGLGYSHAGIENPDPDGQEKRDLLLHRTCLSAPQSSGRVFYTTLSHAGVGLANVRLACSSLAVEAQSMKLSLRRCCANINARGSLELFRQQNVKHCNAPWTTVDVDPLCDFMWASAS